MGYASHLEALKDELIEGQRLAADEAGRVLVWTGDTETPASPASPSPLHAPSPAASSPLEAERRRLCRKLPKTGKFGLASP